MSAADFQAVVSALELGGMPVRPEPPPIHTAAVLGGGALGQALAAACLAGGLEVRLWSASGATLSALAGAGALTVRGDDLVGSYSVDSDAPVHVELTGSIDQAMSGADVVFITGTVADQRVAAMLAAQWAVADQMLVMVPGLTFGALELHWWLRTGPRRPACLVAELNPEPWTITPTGPAAIELTGRPAARLATMPAQAGAGVAEALAAFLPPVELHPTVVHTSLSDTSGIVEVPALVLGGPGLAPDPETLLPGAVPRSDAPMASLTPQLAAVIGALAGERREVAARWGIRDVPPDPTWLAGAFDEVGRALHRLGGGAARIRIEDLAAGSLVPLSSAAAAVGVAIPATNALIEIVSTMLDFDARAAGRRLDAMGLASTDLDRIRRATTTAGAG